MGIFNAIYNWFAQREIGEKLGMQWDPNKDVGFQREGNDRRDTMRAAQWLQVDLPSARQWVDAGEYETAHRRVNRALLELSLSEHPLIKQAREEAQKIHSITSAHIKQPDSDKSSNDYFNAAVALAQRLNTPMSYPGEYNSTLAEIVKLCQLAIRKDIDNGDAYVVLANAYLVLAHNGGSDELYDFCINRAGSVIHGWKTRKMYTQKRANGEEIYQAITRHLDQIYPTLAGKGTSVFEMHYSFALNPDDYHMLEEAVNKTLPHTS